MIDPTIEATETIASLKTQLQKARKALEFYQNERNWKQGMFGDIELPSRIKEDGGTVARKALANIGAGQAGTSDTERLDWVHMNRASLDYNDRYRTYSVLIGLGHCVAQTATCFRDAIDAALSAKRNGGQ